MKHLVISVFCVLLLFSCGSKKVVTTTKKSKRTQTVAKKKNKSKEVVKPIIKKDSPEVYANATEEYIAIYSDKAQDEMRQYGVPASITLAQGILESGSGKGRLAKEANNHFGIKCHTSWKGQKIYHDDDEKGECFRKYNNSKYSFRDHKLISLIERYQLYRFDQEVIGVEDTVNQKHTVVQGDTLYSLSKLYKISVEELKALNGLESNELFVGQALFIKPLPKD